MEIVHTHGAGLDVHKKTVVAAISVPGPKRSGDQETRTFGTMTAALLALSDRLTAHGVTQVARARTGEYWQPGFNLLESDFHGLWVNAAHIKAVPGRKTDVNEAQWIADLLNHGLLKASFVPPLGQRERRELTRHRSHFVRERASVVNRVQKVLESANIKLASVATDVLGVSGRALLEALRPYLRIAEYDINGRPIMKAHGKEDVHASQPSNEGGFLANA
jgi:transposase